MSRECKSGFVETYVRYTEPHGAPESFHWWSAVSLIACALGRRVWLDQWAYLLYPNVYVLLVSPSGLCHRSTVVDMAFGVFQQALPGWRYKLFAQKGTPEGLIDAAQESQSVYGKAGGNNTSR